MSIITIKIIKDIYNIKLFKPDYVFNINSNLTLLAGDNGTGKSTLLKLLMCNNDLLNTHYTFQFDSSKIDLEIEESCLFDAELHNPRFRFKELCNPNSKNFIHHAMGMLNSQQKSHGENIIPTLMHIIEQKFKLILIDEPESGLSISNQYKICKLIKNSSKTNIIVIATHSYIFMKELGNIYHLDRDIYTNNSEEILDYYKQQNLKIFGDNYEIGI